MTADDDRELAAASGAYALHSLDGQEARDFEELLARSPGLRDEVTELTDTAVELGLAVAPEPPAPGLRSRVLELAAATPQLPAPATSEPALAPVTRLAWYRRPAAALAAAAAAAVLVVAGAVGAGVAQSAVSASQVAAIAAAPDAQHATVAVAGGGTARVVWSDDLGRSGVRLEGVPALDLGRTYQLWYIDGSTARPAGLLASSGDAVLTGAMHPGDTIGVTVEPVGGSATPTTAPVVVVATS